MNNSDKVLQLLQSFGEKSNDQPIVASEKTVSRFDTQWENAYAFSINDKASVRRALELHKKITEAPKVFLNISFTEEHLNFFTHKLHQRISKYFRAKVIEIAAKSTIDHLLSVDLRKVLNNNEYTKRNQLGTRIHIGTRVHKAIRTNVNATFVKHGTSAVLGKVANTIEYTRYGNQFGARVHKTIRDDVDTTFVEFGVGEIFTKKKSTAIGKFTRQEEFNVQLTISNDDYQRLISAVINSQPNKNIEVTKKHVEELVSSTLNVSQAQFLSQVRERNNKKLKLDYATHPLSK